MSRRTETKTGGRDATTRHIFGQFALSVGMPSVAAPHGWRWVALTDVARMESGHTPSRQHPEYWGGDVPWIGIRDAKAHHGETIHDTIQTTNELGLQNSSARILPEGTVCLSRTASVGYVVTMGRPMATSQDFANWICSDQLDRTFLVYLLLAEQESLLRFASGAIHQTIYYPELKALHVCLPSLSEQQRIVAILDEAFAGLATATANAEKNLQNARELFEIALIANIFGDADDQGWEATTVAKLALSAKGSIRTGPFGSQLLHGEFVDDGIAVLGIDNVVANEFRWGKNRFITPAKFAQLSRYQVRPGDVLITIMGTCGRCAIVPDDIAVAINTKHLCCISLDQTRCLPKYLHAYFLYHPIARTFLNEQAKGSIMAGLNMGIIERLPVRLPPVAKQQSIIQKMDSLSQETRRLEAIYLQRVDVINDLKQSILQKAFSGELTSPPSQAIKEAAE